MSEYRALRAKHSILELCKTPELAAQVTMQPIDRFPLDAAIIFADILLPLEPMGLTLEFAEGEGPVIHNPVRDRALDLELIFMNSIAICIILLAIVAADVFMR